MESSIRIRILDGQYQIIGGDFQSMLEFVRSQPKRRFNSQEKLWEIPLTTADLQPKAEALGFHLTGDTEMGKALQPAPRRPKRGAADRIVVLLGDTEYAVVGHTFRTMLDVIKSLDGRRWLSQRRAWSLPVKLEALRQALSGYNLQVVTLEEAAEMPAVEPDNVEPIQLETQVTPKRDQIRLRASDGEAWVVGGAFRDMLEVIKMIDGRRFVADEKLWEVPVSLAAAKEHLAQAKLAIEIDDAAPPLGAAPSAPSGAAAPPIEEPPEALPDIPWDEPPFDEEDEHLF